MKNKIFEQEVVKKIKSMFFLQHLNESLKLLYPYNTSKLLSFPQQLVHCGSSSQAENRKVLMTLDMLTLFVRLYLLC